MIVEILKDVFQEGSNDRELDRLWNTMENRHRLFLKNDENIEALMKSSWYAYQRDSIKEVISKLRIWSLQSPSDLSVNVTISYEKNESNFSVQEAERFLRQAFLIILENSYNDAPFLDAILRGFSKCGKVIKEHKNEGWIEYHLGGGSTIRDVVRTKKESYASEVFTKEKHNYLRCFVLLDSDKKFPDMEQENDKKQIIEFLKENNIPFHILEKREMENYLPDEAIDTIRDNREFIDAYLRLKPIQKDYFDIEKGFPDKNFEQLSNGIKDLFRGVNDEDKKVFRKRSLAEKYKSSGQTFKSEFPKLFQSEKVTKETLLKRCSHHSDSPENHPYNPKELPGLVERIAKLL